MEGNDQQISIKKNPWYPKYLNRRIENIADETNTGTVTKREQNANPNEK